MMSESRSFAVAFGSNIAPRDYYLNQALLRISRIAGVQIAATSRVYESAGWGREDLDPFLNAVAVGTLAAEVSALDLLLELQHIEEALGRRREVHWGPRTLDLDLLAVGDETSGTPTLQLPHPWIAKRPFVYLPFSEICGIHRAWETLVEPHADGCAVEAQSRPSELGQPFWGTACAAYDRLECTAAMEAESEILGARLAATLLPGDVVALVAPMGTGKSVLARAIARARGVTGAIPSPTYTLCRRYDLAHGPAIEHWDFYRLSGADDLDSTGFDATTDAIKLVEWAELFPDALPPGTLWLRMRATSDSARILEVTRRGRTLPFPLLAALE